MVTEFIERHNLWLLKTGYSTSIGLNKTKEEIVTYGQQSGTSRTRARYQTIGLFSGPLLAASLMVMPPLPGMTPEGWNVVALMALMGCWWATEAIPVPATSLIPLAWLPLFDVTTASGASMPYANPVIFLLLGGFILAMGLQRWQLHRRLALIILSRFASKPHHLIGGFMVVSATLSMWISNTASVLMLLPIAAHVTAHVLHKNQHEHPFAISLYLGIAYAASIGGLGTIIGTPPNAFVVGFIKQSQNIEISFLQWMAFGVPVVACMVPAAWFVLTKLAFPFETGNLVSAKGLVQRELDEMGPISVPERRTAYIFGAAAIAWMFLLPLRSATGLSGLSNMVVAIVGALAMFLVPAGGKETRGQALLDWEDALTLPWGVILMFGGGLSLAGAIQTTGLASWLGVALGGLAAMDIIFILASLTALVIFLTEITSNTATVAALVPIFAALAVAAEIDPVILAVPLAMAGSCAFMLPVATGPNAVVFSSGQVSVPQMISAGFRLNFLGIAVITLVTYALVPLIFS